MIFPVNTPVRNTSFSPNPVVSPKFGMENNSSNNTPQSNEQPESNSLYSWVSSFFTPREIAPIPLVAPTLQSWESVLPFPVDREVRTFQFAPPPTVTWDSVRNFFNPTPTSNTQSETHNFQNQNQSQTTSSETEAYNFSRETNLIPREIDNHRTLTDNHGTLIDNHGTLTDNYGTLADNYGNYIPRDINENAGSEIRNNYHPGTVNEENLGIEAYNYGTEATSSQNTNSNLNTSNRERTVKDGKIPEDVEGKVPEGKRGKFTFITDFFKKVSKKFKKKKSD